MKTIRGGMIGCGAVTEVKSGPGFYKSTNSSLLAVTTTIGVMFLVWMPVHDQILASLRVTRGRRLKCSGYAEAFISAPQGRSSPPPRHRHR